MTDLFRTAKKFIFGTSSPKNTNQISPISKKKADLEPEEASKSDQIDILPQEILLNDPLLEIPLPEGKRAKLEFLKLRRSCGQFNAFLSACLRAPQGKKLRSLHEITTIDEEARQYLANHFSRVRTVYNDIFNPEDIYDSYLEDRQKAKFVLGIKGKDRFKGEDTTEMYNGIVRLNPVERKDRFNKIKFHSNDSFNLLQSRPKIETRNELFSILPKPKSFGFLKICFNTQCFSNIFKKQAKKPETEAKTEALVNQDSQDSNSLNLPSPRFAPIQGENVFEKPNLGQSQVVNESLTSQPLIQSYSQAEDNAGQPFPTSQVSFNQPQIKGNVFTNVANKPNNLDSSWNQISNRSSESSIFKPQNVNNVSEGSEQPRWSNSSQSGNYPKHAFSDMQAKPIGGGNLTAKPVQGSSNSAFRPGNSTSNPVQGNSNSAFRQGNYPKHAFSDMQAKPIGGGNLTAKPVQSSSNSIFAPRNLTSNPVQGNSTQTFVPGYSTSNPAQRNFTQSNPFSKNQANSSTGTRSNNHSGFNNATK